MTFSGKTPTKAEKLRLNRICEFGCIVCHLYLDVHSPALPHHIEGKTKKGAHYKTIPLCAPHHDYGGEEGVALHKNKYQFVKNFGSELDLLDKINALIGFDGVKFEWVN